MFQLCCRRKKDWDCKFCSYNNFGSNVKCRNCSYYKNNWKCAKCYYINFANNIACRNCNAEKNEFKMGKFKCNKCGGAYNDPKRECSECYKYFSKIIEKSNTVINPNFPKKF